MFDAKRLIDQLLGAGTGGRLQQSVGDVLGQLGQAASQGQAKAGAAVEQASKMSPGEMARTAKDYVTTNAGTLAAGAAAGTLLSLLLGTKTGRSIGGTAVQLGGLAAIGGLAYKAWQDYQAGRPPLGLGTSAQTAGAGDTPLLPAPQDSGFGADAVARLALEAMISAAKADGHVDDQERARIVGALDAAGVGSDARAFLDAELAKPLDIDALTAKVTSPELAAQTYAASLLVIDPDTDAERTYLAELARRLGIDDRLKAHLEGTVSQAKVG